MSSSEIIYVKKKDYINTMVDAEVKNKAFKNMLNIVRDLSQKKIYNSKNNKHPRHTGGCVQNTNIHNKEEPKKPDKPIASYVKNLEKQKYSDKQISKILMHPVISKDIDKNELKDFVKDF